MSDNSNDQIAPDTDDLDAFENLFHGHETKKEVAEKPEEEVTPEEDTLENAEETAEAEDEGESEDKPEDEEPKPETRAQKRITQLVQKEKETQRLLDEALAKLAAKEKEPEEKKVEKPTPTRQATAEEDGPKPDDTDENGEDKYPLGEFDPRYIRDLTRFTIQQEREASDKEREQAEATREQEAAQRALEADWGVKLEDARTKYEDLTDKTQILENTFRSLDPSYGQYLASTIMSMDFGPDVLYHLANNLDEAKKIVESGPAKATVALGRLEARFALHSDEKQEKKLKVSNAPKPPETLNKGSSVSKHVAADTDDLDAFEALMFKAKKKT